jgi:hypothetical protein
LAMGRRPWRRADNKLWRRVGSAPQRQAASKAVMDWALIAVREDRAQAWWVGQVGELHGDGQVNGERSGQWRWRTMTKMLSMSNNDFAVTD